MATTVNDWAVVRAHLQTHGQATYRELLDALTASGLSTTEGALYKRIKRWEQRGLVVVERRGFPPTAFVHLTNAHFGQIEPQLVQNDLDSDLDNLDNDSDNLDTNLDTSAKDMSTVVQIDATTIFNMAADFGFPKLVVEYPDGKSRLHIAGTREGWRLTLPYLVKDNVLQETYYALCALKRNLDKSGNGAV